MKFQYFVVINMCFALFISFSVSAETSEQVSHPFRMSSDLKAADMQSIHMNQPGIKKINTVQTEQVAQKQGKVIEIDNAEDFSYLYVETEKEKNWIAGIKVKARQGDNIKYTENVIMNDFFSKSLNRSFAKVVFVSDVIVIK